MSLILELCRKRDKRLNIFTRLLLTVAIFVWMLSAHEVQAKSGTSQLPSKALKALNQGIKATKLKDYELAISYFKQAFKHGGENSPDVRFSLALAYNNLGGHDIRLMI